MDENLKVWFNGKTMKLKDAQVSVATHTHKKNSLIL